MIVRVVHGVQLYRVVDTVLISGEYVFVVW